MGKRLILVLAFALLLGLTCAAYAEVQNVKVSGDLDVLGVFRNNLDLTKNVDHGAPIVSTTFMDKREYWASIARVRVDADLTDNVSATVRLINERNWNGESPTKDTHRNMNIGGVGTVSTDEMTVDLDLAYATLKEFLYSPLTLTVGRQELHFGNDWIVGDPDTNMISLQSNISDGDLSKRKAFDAIRATLDYNPLVVDVIYAKSEEKLANENDDTTLSGINARYDLDKNTMIEGFFFQKIIGSQAAAVTHVDGGTWDATTNLYDKSDIVNTVGARVVNKTVKNLTVDVSAAYQFGRYNPKFDPNAAFLGGEYRETVDRNAWGLEALVTYDLKDIKQISKYAPSISAAYLYLSGNRNFMEDNTYTGWDAMYENQTFGSLINAIFGFTDCTLIGLSAQAKPIDDLTVKVDAVGLWFNKRFPAGRDVVLSGIQTAKQFRMEKNPFAGQEYDLTVSYDYTEDVQFSLLGGVFLPSKAINGNDDNSRNLRAAATELIGSMKVTF